MEYTAPALRAEAKPLREYAQGITEISILNAIHELVEELELRARELEEWDDD